MPHIPVDRLKALIQNPDNWLSGEVPMPGKSIFRASSDIEKVLPQVSKIPAVPPVMEKTGQAFDAYLQRLIGLLKQR